MKDFFKQVFSSCLGTLLALGLLSTLSISVFIALIALFASQETTSSIEDESILVFDGSLIIQDRPPSSNLGDVFSDGSSDVMSLRDVLRTIRTAADDGKIAGMLIDGRNGGFNGYSTLKEVREALKDFREAGKKIYVYDVNMSEREYYLASMADEIWLNPVGGLEINGFGVEQMFWTGAFEKYGIGVQVVRAGTYKGAVEPFTRKDFSPENREQTQVFLEDLWTDFKNTTAGDRGIEPNVLQNFANTQGIIEPDAAKSANLVTRLGYFDEILDEVKEFTGTDLDEDFPQITIASYRSQMELDEIGEISSDNEVAIVYAEGSIIGGNGSPNSIGGDSLSKELRKVRLDENTKAVVLRINSPGGSAIASDIILRELKLIREAEIPVIVSMGDIAASGGYWIATESDYIFAQNNTITGSIGVFGILPNIQKIGNDNGFSWDVVKTSELANLFSGSQPKTEKELAIFQNFVNDIYDDFLERVSNARGLTKEEVNKIAQGRVWSGEDAKNIKLVDEIGGLDAAIAHAVKVAELGDDFTLVEFPKQQTWEEEIIENLFGGQTLAGEDIISEELRQFQAGLDMWRSLNDPKQVYAIFPWQFEID